MSKVVKAGQAQAQQAVVLSARMPQLGPAGNGLGPDDEYFGDAGCAAAGQSALDPEAAQAQSQAQEILALASIQARQELHAAQLEAGRLLAEAQAQCQTMLATAEADIAGRRERLEHETRAQLEAEYSARYLAAMLALEGAAADLRAQQEAYLAQLERPAFELVLAIARQLLGSELSRSPQFIGCMIARAFQLLQPEQVAIVAVNPLVFQQLAADGMLHQALSRAGIKPERIELEIDETLRPDQFSLRVSGMHLDYDLSSALEEMLAHLSQRAEDCA